MAPKVPAQRTQQLLDWFRSEARDLPWRRARTLYGTWISEIMLQQTTVATVIPYFDAFMRQFPNVRSLAAADEADVLALWTGLGYYRRARHLHQAARAIVADHDGRFPTDAAGWRQLPGVGEYAAGAIASQALGEKVPAIDANARRVLSRWFCAHPDEWLSLKPTAFRDRATTLVPSANPGAWNEAIMELGAKVCKPRKPDCSACPVIDDCAAGLAGTAADIPPPARKAEIIPVALGLLLLKNDDSWLLTVPGQSWSLPVPVALGVARQDTRGLHQGLHGLPSTPWLSHTPAAWEILTDKNLARSWVQEITLKLGWPAGASEIRHLGAFAHAITRYRLKVQVWGVSFASGGQLPVPDAGIWTTKPHQMPRSQLVDKSMTLWGIS